MKENKSYIIIILFILLSAYSFCQPEIPIDSSLKNKSDKWNVKIRQKGFIGNKPSAVSFGPVKTLDTDAGRAKKIGREKENDLFWKTVTTQKSKEGNMTVVYEADTIVLNMLVVTQDLSRNRSVLGKVLNVDKDEAYKSSSWADEVVIQMQDSTLWRFTKTNLSSLVSDYTGVLKAGTDSFFIKAIDNYSGSKNRMFAMPAAGFIILHNDKQVAALQTMIRQTVWLSKELEDVKKKVLTSLIAALFAVTKLSYGNSPAE